MHRLRQVFWSTWAASQAVWTRYTNRRAVWKAKAGDFRLFGWTCIRIGLCTNNIQLQFHIFCGWSASLPGDTPTSAATHLRFSATVDEPNFPCRKAEASDVAMPVNASFIAFDVAWVTLVRLDYLGVPSHIVPGGGRSMLSCFFTFKGSAHNLYWILLKVSPCLACSLSARFWTLSGFSSKASIFFSLRALVGLFSSSSEPDKSITIDLDRARLWGLEESPSHQSWPAFSASFSSLGPILFSL